MKTLLATRPNTVYVIRVRSSDTGIDLDGPYSHEVEVTREVFETVRLLEARIEQLEKT